MSQVKTTRAFRTISEAGEELGLQPHVLRFWESKFSQIKPIKRGGGRRFYRPEDIEFIRGIKKLLHDEKHPIKDVQKLIQKKGAGRVVELGRSVEKAAKDQPVAETDLLPKRIKPAEKKKAAAAEIRQPKEVHKKEPPRLRMPVLRAKKAPPPVKKPPPVVVDVAQANFAKANVAEGKPAEQSHLPESKTTAEPEVIIKHVEGPARLPDEDKLALEEALGRLQTLKAKLSDFRKAAEAS